MDKAELLIDWLKTTWPAQMLRGAARGAMLPGDVLTGRVAPGTSEYEEGVQDLSGLLVGGLPQLAGRTVQAYPRHGNFTPMVRLRPAQEYGQGGSRLPSVPANSNTTAARLYWDDLPSGGKGALDELGRPVAGIVPRRHEAGDKVWFEYQPMMIGQSPRGLEPTVSGPLGLKDITVARRFVEDQLVKPEIKPDLLYYYRLDADNMARRAAERARWQEITRKREALRLLDGGAR